MPATRDLDPVSRPAAALLLLIAAAPAQAAVAKSYTQAVALYASGDRDAAVSQLGEISEGAIGRELKELHRALAPGAPACLLCDRPAWLLAALMLHTDRALAERAQLRQGADQPQCADSIHLRAAAEIAEIVAHRVGDRDDSARRWAAAMAMRARADGCMQDAVRFVDLGLTLYPRDPTLLLVRGAVHETIATILVRPERAPLPGLTGTQLQQARGAEMEYRRELDLAVDSYQSALASSPERVEARVRLGRAEWLAGHPDKARASLEAALRTDPAPGLAYLAHLFLGRCDEDVGRFEDAQREYRAALELDPTAQVAGVALSHALLTGGEEVAAQQVLGAALGHARREENDAYWSYPMGGFEFAEGLFEQLRKESLR